jgi:hypothetical protein
MLIVTLFYKYQVNADIMIFSDEFNPVTKIGYYDSATSVSTNSDVILKANSDIYNLIIRDRISQKVLLLKNISINSGASDTILDTLGQPGSVQGIVRNNILIQLINQN